jgi:DNA mismatch endonuclease, patch repair protein
MRATRQRDTSAELLLRRILHANGLRYHVDRAVLPGVRRRVDVVFPSIRLAVFIDGCFWHCCPIHGTWPKANSAWWAAKLEANRQRDAATDQQLRAAGWRVERVWEHDSPEAAAKRITRIARMLQRKLIR